MLGVSSAELHNNDLGEDLFSWNPRSPANSPLRVTRSSSERSRNASTDEFAQYFFGFGDNEGRSSRNNSTAKSVVANEAENNRIELFPEINLNVISPPRTRPGTPVIAQKIDTRASSIISVSSSATSAYSVSSSATSISSAYSSAFSDVLFAAEDDTEEDEHWWSFPALVVSSTTTTPINTPINSPRVSGKSTPIPHQFTPIPPPTPKDPTVDGTDEKRPRRQVKVACTNCKKACKRCDEARPCSRCVRVGKDDCCVDAPRKERKKGFKRGPYRTRKIREAEERVV